MVYSFVKENKLMVALAILLAVIAGVSTLSDFQNRVSAQGNNSNSSGGLDDEKGGNGNQLQGSGALCGFAWGAEGVSVSSGSRNGAGWVSFNSQDCDTDDNGTISSSEASAHLGCPAGATANYGVVADSNGDLQGYAWSSNLGWLKFGSLSGMPSGGSNQQNARIDGNGNGDNNVSGWARFCAGTTTGDCSGSDRTDGWDGWLSMRDTNAGGRYGVTFNGTTQKFAGYSWGGPVVGWLKWDQTDGNGVRYCTASTLTASLTANPSSGAAPLSSVLTANPTGASYRFACKATDSLSSSQSSNTYNCQYTTAGQTYVPRVEVTSGGQTVTAYTTVTTDTAGGGGGPGNGALSLSCQIVNNPPVVVGGQAAINRPVVWRATATTDGTTVADYTYTFEFDDNNDGTFGGAGDESDYVTTTSNLIATSERMYRLLGRKSVRVVVQDSSLPTPVSAQCEPASVIVVVTPRIIEF